MNVELNDRQMKVLSERVSRDVIAWVDKGVVERHYSAEQIAELLGVEVRSVASYAKAYEQSGGREGLGPKVFLSHKAVRYAASSLRRFLEQRTLRVEREREQLQEASAT